MRKAVGFFVILTSFIACAHMSEPQELLPEFRGISETRLVLFSGNNGGSKVLNLKENIEAMGLGKKEIREEQLLQDACQLNKQGVPRGEFTEMALSFVIEQTISYLSQALQERMQEYTHNFTASQTENFYIPPSSGNHEPVLAFDCFRLTKKYESPDQKSSVVMDFVGKFQMDGREFMKVMPLRLYYSRLPVKSEYPNSFGVAIAMDIGAIWRENNKGQRADHIFDQVLLSEKVTIGPHTNSKGETVFYRNYYASNRHEKLAKISPIIPWSFYDEVSYGGNHTSVTITVSEVGKPSWILEHTKEWFDANKDTLETLSLKAAKAVLQ